MTVFELSVLYVLLGCGCAIALFIRGPSRTMTTAFEAAALVVIWPLYAPFCLSRSAESEPARPYGDSPMAALLPDAATIEALSARLDIARARVQEIDDMLARPQFSEQEVTRRLVALRERGASEATVSSITMRVHNIRRLRELKKRFQCELDEVGELLEQLITQAEVVRLVGSASEGTGELVRELQARVEGLDQLLDDPAMLL